MIIRLRLSHTYFSIYFQDDTRLTAPQYLKIFSHFLVGNEREDAHVTILFAPEKNSLVPITTNDGWDAWEKVIPTADAVSWLGVEKNNHFSEILWDDKTICIGFLTGMSVFQPDTLHGVIILPGNAKQPFQALYRLLWIFFAQVLGEKGECFLHATALERGKRGYLFLGESGGGKTTIARLSSQDCFLLSDEGPILGQSKEAFCLYPSPYFQLASIGRSIQSNFLKSSELRGIYFINKNQKSYVAPMDQKKALAVIIARHVHFFHCFSKKTRVLLFDLLHGACDTVDTYMFHFTDRHNPWGILFP
jgi:hypothetical protein